MWCGFTLSHEAARETASKRQAGLEAVAYLVDGGEIDGDGAVEAIDGLIDQ